MSFSNQLYGNNFPKNLEQANLNEIQSSQTSTTSQNDPTVLGGREVSVISDLGGLTMLKNEFFLP